MSNYSTLKAAISAVIKENNNHEITGQVLQTTLLAMVDSLAGGYLFKGIATPATVVGTPDENVFYIGGAGTYSNFGATPVNVPDCCIGIFTYNGSFENHIIPTGGVFDISAYNAVGGTPATYADLTAALGTGGANIPDYLRKGGMSVKFIQGSAPNSDNKYIQARCMAQNFTTDVTQWQVIDDALIVEQEVGNIMLTKLVDSNLVTLEQGAFSSTGGNTDSQTRIRTQNAISTDNIMIIGVPYGYVIREVFYYSSWESIDNFTFEPPYETVDKPYYQVKKTQPFVRFSIKKIDNSEITPNDVVSKLILISPQFIQLNEQLKNELIESIDIVNERIDIVNDGTVNYKELRCIRDCTFSDDNTMMTGSSYNMVVYAPAKSSTQYVVLSDEPSDVIGIGFTRTKPVIRETPLYNVQRGDGMSMVSSISGTEDIYVVATFPMAQRSTIKFIEISSKVENQKKYQFQTSEVTSITGLFIRDNGSIGSASNTKILYIPCKEKECFIVNSSIDSEYYMVGASSSIPGYGTQLLLCQTNIKGSGELYIETPKGSSYLVVCCDVNDNNVNIECLIPTKEEIISVPMVRGKYDNSGDRYAFVSYRTTHSLNLLPLVIDKNTSFVDLSNFTIGEEVNMYFRDTDGVTIANKIIVINNTLNVVRVPNGTYYIDFFVDNTKNNNDIIILHPYNVYETTKQCKRVYTNSGNNMVECFYINEEEDLFTCSSYYLPPNYSHDGHKVPLIIWFDGNYNYNSMYGRLGGGYESKIKGIEYLRDEGFAVIQIFGWGSYFYNKYPQCGQDMPYPTPTNLQCITEGLQHFLDRYNIDENNIHIACKSMGGLISLYFATHQTFKIKSIGMFSPILDMFGLRGRYSDARKAIYEDMAFRGGDAGLTEFADINFECTVVPDNRYFSQRCIDNTWSNNMDKMVRLNAAYLGLIGGTLGENFDDSILYGRTFIQYSDDGDIENLPVIYDKTSYKKISCIPVKMWGVTLDDNVPYSAMVEIVAQMQNAGNQAELETVVSSNHSYFDAGGPTVSGVTRLGITYTNVCNGWPQLADWFYENIAK